MTQGRFELAVMVAVVLALGPIAASIVQAGQQVSNEELGLALEIPDEFKVSAGGAAGPDQVFCYREANAPDEKSALVIYIHRMRQQYPNGLTKEEIASAPLLLGSTGTARRASGVTPGATTPPGSLPAGVGPFQFVRRRPVAAFPVDWDDHDVLGGHVSFDAGEGWSITDFAVLPLAPEAIRVDVSGPESRPEEIRATFNRVVATVANFPAQPPPTRRRRPPASDEAIWVSSGVYVTLAVVGLGAALWLHRKQKAGQRAAAVARPASEMTAAGPPDSSPRGPTS